MNSFTEENVDGNFRPFIPVAEQILSKTLGAPICIDRFERISEEGRRNLLLRGMIGNALAGFPTSFIIKQVKTENYNPNNIDTWDTVRFFQDWAGLEILSTLSNEARHAPQFYGGSREQGFVILEDLGHEHHSLVEPLLEGDAAEAEQALLKLVIRLGQMHADTYGQAKRFEEIFHSLHPNLSLQPSAAKWHERLENIQTTLESLTPLDTDFLQEVEGVLTRLATPESFFTYVHGDPCPDNVFYSDGLLRLIDFELGRFGLALSDAVYGRMMFPTCWCANRIPKALITRMEAAYRTELIQGCLQAQDDRLFEGAIVDACAFWLFGTLDWQLTRALEEDRQWGISTLRPRVLARLEAFITTSEDFGHLPAIRGTASQVWEVLSKRWPDVEPLPLYPAFRG